MAQIFYDRIKETTVTTGTGTLSLAGAVADFLPFSTIGDGHTCYYVIDDGSSNWEVGIGTYASSGNTLARTSVLSSSNSNAAVNFAAGSKNVWLDVAASWLTSIPNGNLANSSLTVTAGSGLGGGGAVSLGGAVTLTADVTSVAGRTGAVTLSNGDISGLGGLATLSAAPAGTLTGTTLNSTVVTSSLTSVGTLSAGSIPYSLVTGGPSAVSGANPSASIGLTAVNGSAGTFLRSDGAPTINQAAAWAFSALGNTNLTVGNVLSWNSDTGISRTAAAAIAVGNGTQGDTSGGIRSNSIQVNSIGIAIIPSLLFSTSGANKQAELTSPNSTSPVYWRFTNNDISAQLYFGVESSTGGGILNNTAPKAAVFGTGNSTIVQLGSNNTVNLSLLASGTTQLGPLDATAPTAQTLRFQSVASTATANTAAPDATYIASLGLGNAPTGGRHIWQVGIVRASGTLQQIATTAMILDNNLALTLVGEIIKYNNIATVGWGVPAIYGSGRTVGAVAAVASVATYTVGAADGTFMVSANVLVTTSTLHNFTVTVAYTDEGNTSRVLTLQFSNLAGTLLTAIVNTAGAVPYEGVPLHIRCKASTAITIATAAGGTYTTVAYNVEGLIEQHA